MALPPTNKLIKLVSSWCRGNTCILTCRIMYSVALHTSTHVLVGVTPTSTMGYFKSCVTYLKEFLACTITLRRTHDDFSATGCDISERASGLHYHTANPRRLFCNWGCNLTKATSLTLLCTCIFNTARPDNVEHRVFVKRYLES